MAERNQVLAASGEGLRSGRHWRALAEEKGRATIPVHMEPDSSAPCQIQPTTSGRCQLRTGRGYDLIYHLCKTIRLTGVHF